MRYVRHIVLAVLISALTISGYAQRTMTAEEAALSTGGRMRVYEGIYREGIPELLAWNLSRPESLDESRIVVKYDVGIRVDTLSDKRVRDQVLTLIGPRVILSHGLWFWRECVSLTADVGNKEDRAYYRSILAGLGGRLAGYTGMINWFIYRNPGARTVLNKHALPLRMDYAIEYTEPTPQMSWSILEDTREILGYECQRAEADFRGRHWTVWFAPEIPVDCGLWKFSGLPGLIMEATSLDGFYSYTAVSIENKITKIQSYPKLETKHLSRERFRVMERSVFANPIIGGKFHQESGQDFLMGAHISSEPKETDSMIFTSNNYLGLYFPMELE